MFFSQIVNLTEKLLGDLTMNMLKGEWKSIISKPMNILIIVGLLFVPFLYNVIFLSAYWDPYGKTDQIPVAVVNEDKGATLDGKELHVGDDFVENLKDNDTFDWRFTNKEEALEGLKNEKYYLVLELPSNFSENATTLMDEDPKKMKFVYHTNAGKNYSGAQIGSNAVTKINEQIKEEVTKQYAETVFDSFKEVADGLQEASDGAGKIEDGSKTLRDNLKKLAESTVAFEDGVEKLADGISDANKGATDLHSATVKLLEGATQINEKQGELAKGIGTAADGAKKLQEGSDQLYTASKQLETGAGTLQEKLGELQTGTKELEGKLPEFVSGLNEANTKVNEVANEIAVKQKEAAALKEKIDSVRQSFDTKKQQLITSINENESIPDDQKQKLIADINELSNQQFMEQQQEQIKELKAKVDQVQVLANGLQELSKGGQDIQSAIGKISDGQSQIYDGAAKLAASEKTFNEKFGTFNEKFTTFNSGMETINSGANKLVDATGDLKEGIQKTETGSGKLAGGLDELNKGGQKLVNGSKDLQDGSNKLYDGSSDLADGTSELHSSLQEGANDAKEVNPNDKTYSMFASPTDLQDDKQNNVDKYGVGLTPYILCIGLFAGALMFSSVYSLKDPAITPTSGFAWFLSKFSVIGFMAIFQSILVATALLWGLDLHVTSVWRFYVFTIITGLTFFTLVLFLTTALGKVGQFLTFIVLLLQIGGSSGTFPKALVPEFFQVINPFLPMTYAIRGFREIISVGNDYGFAWSQAGVLGIFALVFIILTIIIFSLNARKFRKVNEDEEATA